MQFITQLIGYLALLCYILTYWQKKRTALLLFGFLESVLFGIHYILLGSVMGGVLDVFAGFQLIVYIFKDKNKLFKGYYVPAFFFAVNIVIAVFTYDGWISLLPLAAVLFACWTDWAKNTKVIRISALLQQVLWFVYGILLLSVPAMIGDGLVILSTLIAIYSLDIRKKKPLQFTNHTNIPPETVV